jgi:site-specific DNA-methyltransferase (adenine-specific)
MQRLTPDQVFLGDCRSILQTFPEGSIACCITDPPYNYEFIGRNWDHAEIARRLQRIQDSSTLVKNIPYGSGLAGGVRNRRWYERNRENIVDYQKWCVEWGRALFRVYKPGAVVAVFSSTRTFAHVQVALEEVGFYARDCLVYRRHSGIPKGLNLKRKLEKLGHQNAEQWNGWHTCFRSEWEAIAVLQKPLINNYIETIKISGLGPFRTINKDGSFQSNILEGFCKGDEESFDAHCTIKPLALIRKLIGFFVPNSSQNIILDPFAGSGTTLVAAKQLGCPYVGVEIEKSYVALIKKRLADLHAGSLFPLLGDDA